jgi:hypothetical protein
MGEKDLDGQLVTLAEVEQELGPQAAWGDAAARVTRRNTEKRRIFGLPPDEAGHLAQHPPYVTHCLRHCARSVLAAPRAVFEGLRRSGLDAARAYCGKPVFTYDNDGRATAAPDGFVYVVYTDRDGSIFDWDWVEADERDPSLPVDHATRFATRVERPTGANLASVPDNLPSRFDPSVAVYSACGDCVFAYFSAAPSYAARVNEDLTVFRAFDGQQPVGCKVKNIRAILKLVEQGGEAWSTGTQELSVRVALVVATSYARHVAKPNVVPPIGYADVFKAFEEAPVPPEVWLPRFLSSGGAQSAHR